jgi:tetratricopeptide (TPR) repeat protein
VPYHPETSFNPERLSFRSAQPGAPALDLAAYMSLGTDARQRDWLVSITPSCPTAWPLRSWLYGVEGQLLAFWLTAYRADFSPELDLIEASDHEAMRVVGARLFRSSQRGSFLYGPLRYERWDEAFAAPTEQAMLSILAGGFRAARQSAGANNRYAVGLYAVGRRKEALEHLLRAAELEPKWALPHANLAIAYRQAGELEALEAARRAARERRIPLPQGDIKALP